MTRQAILAWVFATVLVTGAVAQQAAVYTWTGSGVNVRGASGSRIMLDGYCKSEGPLAKKQ